MRAQNTTTKLLGVCADLKVLAKGEGEGVRVLGDPVAVELLREIKALEKHMRLTHA